MEYAAIAGAVSASAGAVDSITKLIGSIRVILGGGKLTETDVKGLQEKVSSLLDVALTAKSAQFDMQSAITSLKAENETLKGTIASMEAFDAEAQNYDLRAVSPNSFAYLKKGTPEKMGETPYLCVPCFDDRRKSLLLFSERAFHFDTLKCPKCGTTVRVPNGNEPTVVTVPGRTRWDFDPMQD